MIKQVLFKGGSLKPTTPVVDIPEHGVITFVGFGLQDDQAFGLELVVVEAKAPKLKGGCVPAVQLPKIVNSTPLMRNCERVAVTACNNVVEISAPKGFGIRAVRIGSNYDAELWYSVKES